jgi:hypothetical protein
MVDSCDAIGAAAVVPEPEITFGDRACSGLAEVPKVRRMKMNGTRKHMSFGTLSWTRGSRHRAARDAATCRGRDEGPAVVSEDRNDDC